MMRAAHWLRHRVGGGHVLVGLAAFLVFAASVLPAQARRAAEVAAGAGSPDLSVFYTAADLDRMAEAYGPDGRRAYLRARWGFDLAFPIVYGFSLVTAIAWTMKTTSAAGSTWNLASLVPLGAVLFDLLENTATSLVMAAFPAPAPLASAISGWLTLMKWILVAGSLGLLGIGLGRLVLRRRPQPPMA